MPRSYRQLHALTLRIAKDRHSLVKQGVHLQSWGPQPSSGSLVIVLTRPPHSTTPSRQYYFYAARILQDRYGDAVTVNPIVQTPLHADSG
ncbi:MAG TPA: hypothetical protein VFJ19_10710 [Nocardioidaceae bacterium]|nr:hypothetical protein [Nocardioidaceae bacterium]